MVLSANVLSLHSVCGLSNCDFSARKKRSYENYCFYFKLNEQMMWNGCYVMLRQVLKIKSVSTILSALYFFSVFLSLFHASVFNFFSRFCISKVSFWVSIIFQHSSFQLSKVQFFTLLLFRFTKGQKCHFSVLEFYLKIPKVVRISDFHFFSEQYHITFSRF